MQQHVDEQRQHAEYHQDAGLLALDHGRAASPPQADESEDGNERASESDVAADQLEKIGKRETVPARHASELLGERRPPVLRIPHHHGNVSRHRDGTTGP